MILDLLSVFLYFLDILSFFLLQNFQTQKSDDFHIFRIN